MLVLILVYILETVALMAIALREATRPQRALSWLVIGIVAPVIGPLLYLALSWPVRIHRQGVGRSARQRTSSEQRGNDTPAPDAPADSLVSAWAATENPSSTGPLSAALTRITGQPPRPGRVRVLTNGPETYEALVDALKSAQRRIDMEYYIYRADHVGRLVTATLMERAQAGVKIRFVRDGVGSRQFPKETVAEMAAVGIACRTLFPLRFPWIGPRLNYRDHCKIVVVDDEIAFLGGINIGDEYTGLKPGIGHWRDTHLCLTGEGVSALTEVFEMNWSIATADSATPEDRAAVSDTNHRRQARWRWRGRFAGMRAIRRTRPALSVEFADLDGGDLTQSRDPGPAGSEHREGAQGPAAAGLAGQGSEALVQLIASGPDSPSPTQKELFFLCITLAERRVEITTPYFAPDADLIMAMKTAVARGVRVRLLVPKHPDHRLVELASQTYYGSLLESGIEIYQYEPGILHAKVMTVDESVAVVGAANYDPRSFRMNFEVSEVIYSQAVNEHLRNQFERDLESSTPLHLADLRQRPLWQRALDRAARVFAPQL
ncbi:MAG: PLDc N-terminal domain-containing protein [Alicyclobacillus shizuokensis]|nr:PLDc N-terminal domain-containing protein [Alicyclobacillus shizuokensis]